MNRSRAVSPVALTMLALGLAANGRTFAAGLAASAAFLYHPPTALPFWLLFIAAGLSTRDFRSLAPACVRRGSAG